MINFEVVKLDKELWEDGVNYNGIEFHHSATEDTVLQDYNSIMNYHVKVKKWRHIGYNIVIEKVNGKVRIIWGRPLGMKGAHDSYGNNNKTKIGVCVVGNFEKDLFDADYMEAVGIVVRTLREELGSHLELFYHGEFSNTACAGKNFPSKRAIEEYIIYKLPYKEIEEKYLPATDLAEMVELMKTMEESLHEFLDGLLRMMQ